MTNMHRVCSLLVTEIANKNFKMMSG